MKGHGEVRKGNVKWKWYRDQEVRRDMNYSDQMVAY